MNTKASAGNRGKSVRSDAWVEVRRNDSGDNTITISGKAQTYYPIATRELIEAGIEHFCLQSVDLVVEDQGALPFVLMARLETAVRRFFPGKPFDPWLPPPGPSSPESARNRNRRSRLYLPGNMPKYMINAPIHSPDGLILDLEDSVAPNEKDAARAIVRNALVHLDFCQSEKMVRINQGEAGLEDLDWIIPFGVQLVLIPKAETVKHVVDVADRIAKLKKEHSLQQPVWLMPIIESAKGAWFAYDIAMAHPDVVSLAVGLEDYTADIGAQRTNEGRESFWARAQVINAARAAGVQPIDTVFSDVADNEGLLASVREAKALGFEGKGCIHPRQIDLVKKGFAPTEKEIEKAKKITLAFEKAQREGIGVVSLGSKMIDPPVLKRALRIIEQAENDQLIPGNWREMT